MRPIDGDELIAWIKESQQMTSKMKAVICKIKTMPSADRPQGEWIDNGDKYFRCSLCGIKDTDTWDWCHGCGARMKGADDEH